MYVAGYIYCTTCTWLETDTIKKWLAIELNRYKEMARNRYKEIARNS